MTICNLGSLENLTVESARTLLRQYIEAGRGAVRDYDGYFYWITPRLNPHDRFLKLLEIVRYGGWNMNRRSQCESIACQIRAGTTSLAEVKGFWGLVDTLPRIQLRDLPTASRNSIGNLERGLDAIRQTLRTWDPACGTLCFLTKVILMFNWGQSPVFDSVIQAKLQVASDISSKDLVVALQEIGAWIRSFESKTGVRLGDIAREEILQAKCGICRKPVPLGRSFDMLVYRL